MARLWRSARLLAAALLGTVVCLGPNYAADVQAPAAVRSASPSNETTAPVAEQSVRFAVLGDTGTGDDEQYEVGAKLWESFQIFPFDFVIMLGDNLYGSERPQDYRRKFELPYKPLLHAKVLFYASLGNHDDTNQIYYDFFNMGGRRYYTFEKKAGATTVRFFALDSNYMSQAQLEWLERELARTTSTWTIAFFHHPIYSSGGRHGSEEDLREQLEPLFIKYGVDVVFAGHEHFYERIKPQHGIYYFIAGGSARLRRGDIQESELTAAGFDTDNSYMLVEIAGDVLYFQTLSRTGRRVDSGTIVRPSSQTPQ